MDNNYSTKTQKRFVVKKALYFLMAITILLSFSSCKKKEERIELNLSNYETYIEVAPYSTDSFANSQTVAFWSYNSTQKEKMYDSITFGVEIKGVSQNFNYYDVEIVGEFSGETYTFPVLFIEGHDEVQTEECYASVTAKANIAGNGEGKSEFYSEKYQYSKSDYFSGSFNVVSVSGYVVPVNTK